MEPPEDAFVLGPSVEPAIASAEREVDEFSAPLAVHYEEPTLLKIMEHAVRFRNTEVFGLLVGGVLRTPSDRLRTMVGESIPARQLMASTAVYVRVSAAELIRMDNEYHADLRGQGLFTVGWYHTHPGHGIFMSSTDKKNHAMYHKPWQVALVVDPIHRTFGFFGGPECAAIPSYVGKKADAPSVADVAANLQERLPRKWRWWPL
jgi:proteasome lid subunit RPN8/RPN11